MCSKGAKIAELFTKAVASTKCFDQNLRTVKVVSCGEGRMVTEFKVGPEHLNQRGTLHGAFIAHLVDAISTYALTTNETIDTRGVSVDLSISYYTAAWEGDNIEVEAITKKAGKKIAFLEVEVRNKDKNIVLASDHESRHNSYRADVERAPREDTPLLHNRFPPPQGGADGEHSPLTTAVVSSLIIILLAGVIIGIYLLIEQSREENVLPPVEMAVQLVSNAQWDDSNSTRQLGLSPFRARHVVAVQTDTPECRTLHACTHLLREYQNRSGGILPHNFLISSSGHTFEALGWRRRARSFTEYQTPLLVGFIGNFTQSPPSDIQVEEAKRLLDESVSQQCLDPTYVILGKNTRYPAKHLFRRLSKLKQWDHDLSDT